MAGTATYGGTFALDITATATLGTDWAGGQRIPSIANAITLAAAGGTAPTISGWLYGTVTLTEAATLLLAHATDPFAGAGDSGYCLGFTVASSKLKILYIKNTSATQTIAVARAAANGLTVFDAASDAITLAAGDIMCWYKPAGTAALTTGSNDGLTLTPSLTGATAIICAIYGP